jgi:short-subunit dehydrogenase
MERVVIFAATAAIAREVALTHAHRGDRLHLVGRSADKLADTRDACRAAGAVVSVEQADFSELAANASVVARSLSALGGGVDRALIAHGTLGDQLESERVFSEAEAIFRDNLLSAVSLVIPLANAMESARGGRLGVITSVAGDRGRPRNYTYGAAKGALNVYLQGVRSRVYSAGVTVTTLKLGPVDTPMTRDHAKNALFAEPAPVANAIVRAMDAGVSEAYVPSFWAAIMPVVIRTPERLFQRLPFLSGR